MCINQLTKACSFRKSSEKLINSLIRSPTSFNPHVNADSMELLNGFATDTTGTVSFVFTNNKVYELCYNDEKNLWGDLAKEENFE